MQSGGDNPMACMQLRDRICAAVAALRASGPNGTIAVQTLVISFPGTQDKYETQVSAEEPCVRVWVPGDATGVGVVDESGQSQDGGALVLP